MGKLFQKYFSNIFISIVRQDKEWRVDSRIIKNGLIKDKLSKNFEIDEHEHLPKKMKKYLTGLQQSYNFAYIALFLDSLGQGAIYGVGVEDFKKNSVDIKKIIPIKVDNKWSFYGSTIDISWIKKLFSSTGMDLVYSPFAIQYALLKKERSRKEPILYVLNQQDSVAITVFENNTLLFGVYFKTTSEDALSSHEDDWENAHEESGIENIAELDDMSVDQNDEIDEIVELDDLDDLADTGGIEEFEEISLNNMNQDKLYNEDIIGSDLELFGRDMLIYKYIVSFLREFYSNPIYKSNFLSTIAIYDGYEISSELIDMVENELFMDIEISKIDINETICHMAQKEILN